jgi:hypothetical protein
MKNSETKEYSKFLMGQTHIEIEHLIAKKWESRDFEDQAYKQIAILESPDREVYEFILGATLSNWNKCLQALELMEGNSDCLNRYQRVALKRMRAMIHIAKSENMEAVRILENAYKDIPGTYKWLKRTIAVDIRNITLQQIMSNTPELTEKSTKWQRILLKFTDYNPLLDSNDSNSLMTVIGEFFEAGTKLESTTRFSNSIREVLQLQFRNLFISIRLGYNTGASMAKRNIGLILYQWANIHDDPFLFSSSLYEFLENGNKGEIEKIFNKHSDVLVGNRSNAILLFDKIRRLSKIPMLQGAELIVAEHIYDFLGEDDCEVIDELLSKILEEEPKDHHTLELKRLALKVFKPQSKRVPPDWFLKFAKDKLNKNDEHWWFYLDLFRSLGSIDVSKCDAKTVLELLETILDYFRSGQGLEEFNGISVLYNLAKLSTERRSLVDNFLFKKYGSKEFAFKKYPLYFTALDHHELLDEYQKYIDDAIQELKDGAKQTEQPRSIGIGTYVTAGVLHNIVLRYFPKLKETLVKELSDASIDYCLNPYIVATKKRSVLNLIKLLAEKIDSPQFWNEKLKDIKNKFNDFSTVINDSSLLSGLKSTTLGALAGSTYLKIGGDLSPSLWNHIWRDKIASYNNRIDCVEAMSEIAKRNIEHSLLCFFVLSELVNDESFEVSYKALGTIGNFNEFPENIVPMLCQSIFKASYSGNVSVKIAATYCIKEISEKIKNHYWHNQLETRLKELEQDDCRPVRLQTKMKA